MVPSNRDSSLRNGEFPLFLGSLLTSLICFLSENPRFHQHAFIVPAPVHKTELRLKARAFVFCKSGFASVSFSLKIAVPFG